jgi:hypothetical protein
VGKREFFVLVYTIIHLLAQSETFGCDFLVWRIVVIHWHLLNKPRKESDLDLLFYINCDALSHRLFAACI